MAGSLKISSGRMRDSQPVRSGGWYLRSTSLICYDLGRNYKSSFPSPHCTHLTEECLVSKDEGGSAQDEARVPRPDRGSQGSLSVQTELEGSLDKKPFSFILIFLNLLGKTRCVH